MNESVLLGYNGYPINLYVWNDVKGEPKAVVQIFHGMVEHAMRYNDFARFLNEQGFVVIADDHRGHGKTAKEGLGLVPDGDCFFDTVQDECLITNYAEKEFNLPIIIFGHSYGSFLAQAYIQLNSNSVVGCCLCGSACQNNFSSKIGRIVANLQLKQFGKDKKADLIKNLSFGAYDNKFKKEKRESAWLSVNEENRLKYLSDPFCNYTMSVGFYASFFNGLNRIYKAENLACIRKDLPIYLISGDKDPVGGMGKLVQKLFDLYNDSALSDVSIKLYNGYRHEILNEDIRQEVYEDFNAFANNCLVKFATTQE